MALSGNLKRVKAMILADMIGPGSLKIKTGHKLNTVAGRPIVGNSRASWLWKYLCQ